MEEINGVRQPGTGRGARSKGELPFVSHRSLRRKEMRRKKDKLEDALQQFCLSSLSLSHAEFKVTWGTMHASGKALFFGVVVAAGTGHFSLTTA